jgi:glycosyltransferase involved in cell wall biosynthesis
LKVGYFPFNPGCNPYQHLFASALEQAGLTVTRIPPRKLFPLQSAASYDIDLLQLDWPHDWYQGRNAWTRLLKQLMYRDGLRRLRRIPVVWTAHNLQAHDAADADHERRMIQALVDVCDGIIVLSNAAAELLRQEYRLAPKTQVQVVHHGHYMDAYPNTISREAARARLALPDQSRVVLSLGRLQPYKGLEDLIAAFACIASPGDVLMLVGKSISTEYTRKLHAIAEPLRAKALRVDIGEEEVPDDELQVYFNACDLVALPFRQVLNSGSLLLAMSFGCPVVAPRLGSIPEVAFPEGWFGYDPPNNRGLAGALSDALIASVASDLRQQIRPFTAASYSWASVGIQASRIYRAILDDITKHGLPPARV